MYAAFWTRTNRTGLRSIYRRSSKRFLFTDSKAHAQDGSLLDELRSLLRQSAQSVTVITTGPPTLRSSPSSPSNGSCSTTSKARSVSNVYENENGRSYDPTHASRNYHGATLSSFSSVSFHPYPVIAFSLRLPSRMATRLATSHLHSDSRIDSHPHHHPHAPPELEPTQSINNIDKPKAKFAINFLSSRQEEIARRFSRPDLFPDPFEGVSCTVTERREHSIPLLDNSLGWLVCEVLESFRLNKWDTSSSISTVSSDETQSTTENGNGLTCLSHLFLARVKEVVSNPTGRDLLPLIYHNGSYTTVDPTRVVGNGS